MSGVGLWEEAKEDKEGRRSAIERLIAGRSHCHNLCHQMCLHSWHSISHRHDEACLLFMTFRLFYLFIYYRFLKLQLPQLLLCYLLFTVSGHSLCCFFSAFPDVCKRRAAKFSLRVYSKKKNTLRAPSCSYRKQTGWLPLPPLSFPPTSHCPWFVSVC